MNLFFSVAFVAAVFVPVVGRAQSSADYQTAIRKATETYRGDCTEAGEVVVLKEFYVGHLAGRVFVSLVTDLPLMQASDLFPPEPYTLRGALGFGPVDSESVSLETAAPNQTMKLTAARYAFTLSDKEHSSSPYNPRRPQP